MNFKISTDSVKAIKQYVSYVESKNGDITRHQALVLSHKEGYPSLTYNWYNREGLLYCYH